MSKHSLRPASGESQKPDPNDHRNQFCRNEKSLFSNDTLQADDKLTALIALQHFESLGPVRLARLIELAGSLENFLAGGWQPTSSRGRKAVGRLESQLAVFLEQPQRAVQWQSAQRCRDWLDAHAATAIAYYDERFPPQLRELPDCPLVLYVKGCSEYLSTPSIAIVGARTPTPQGRKHSAGFARALGEKGLAVTSGMALGIDAEAHCGALAAHAPSVAVWATGLDTVYPPQNQQLAEQLEANGCIVTEMPLGTPALRGHFPRRNRIISGLSLGVLVVEAALKSGSLSTANFALDQNRDVFALPGSVHSPLSKGCHRLIKQGAKLVETVDDILDELPVLCAGSGQGALTEPANTEGLSASLSEQERYVVSQMGYEPISYEEIASRTGMDADQLSSLLVDLELSDQLQLQDGMYQRCL